MHAPVNSNILEIIKEFSPESTSFPTTINLIGRLDDSYDRVEEYRATYFEDSFLLKEGMRILFSSPIELFTLLANSVTFA